MMRVTQTASAVPAPSSADTAQTRVEGQPTISRPEEKPHEGAPAPVQEAELDQVIETMNQAVRIFDHALEFEVTKANRIIVRVIDTESGEVIRQIPPEQLVDAFHRMEDALGILLDKRV